MRLKKLRYKYNKKSMTIIKNIENINYSIEKVWSSEISVMYV
jgi:hypothetical protein